MASGKGHYDTAEDYANRRYWFVFVAAGRRIRTTAPDGPKRAYQGRLKAPFVGELAALLTERLLI